MTTAVFPVLSTKPDSASAKRSLEDPSMSVEMEGGYTYTRARFTRTPRKKWSIKYTFISDADKLLLESFWNTVMGGSESFFWTDDYNSTQYAVRFKGEISFIYKGRGGNHRWDVSFDLEEL